MKFLIEPYEKAGSIVLTTTSSTDIRQMFGNRKTRSFYKTKDSKIPTDAIDDSGIHVHYDKSLKCEAVELFSPAEPVYEHVDLLKPSYSDLLSRFRKLDGEVAEDE